MSFLEKESKVNELMWRRKETQTLDRTPETGTVSFSLLADREKG